MSRFVGFLSGKTQYGRWIPEPEIKVRAVAGGATLDFSQALFTQPVITVRASAFWGGVTIIVPPNVAVEQDGKAILGGFGGTGGVYCTQHGTLPESSTSPDSGITIRVEGTAVMAGITAIVNRSALPASLMSWEEAQRVMMEPAPPSTTREDLHRQILGDVLAQRLAAANPEVRATHLQAADESRACSVEAQHEVVQGVVLPVPGKAC